MKTITSAGGPYIVIDREGARLWGANEKKTFSSPSLPFPDDYEAAGDLTDGVSHPPCNIAKLVGEHAEALLITMPYEIAIVGTSASCVYLAQVQYADPEWSFSQVSADTFSEANFDEELLFVSPGAAYMVFDSAYLPEEVGRDCLEFGLGAGKFVFSAAMHKPDQRTGLFLYRLRRVE